MTAISDGDTLRPLPMRTPSGASRNAMSALLRTICVAALVVGIAAGIDFYLHRGSLWEDELIAITHTNEPLPLLFVQVLRNDIHPPLYFLQLDAWLALGPATDAWALANSLCWAAISLIALFSVTRSLHGTRAAWLATALFAVLPNTIWSAGTLRMYAALPACVLFVYYANRRWFDTRSGRWLAVCLVTEVALAYVHAVEFFFIAFIVLGTLLEAARAGRVRLPSVRFAHSVRLWLIVQIVFGFCVLPLAASALVRGSDAAGPDSALAMLTVGGALIAGWKTSSMWGLRIAGTVMFVALVACGLVARDSRWRTLAIPVAALVVAMGVAVMLKPIFKQPVFSANLMPFVVMGAAAATGALAARVVVATCIVLLAVVAFPLSPRQAPAEAYAAAARTIRARALPGDVVVVPNVSVYWGIVRYAVGPAWGRPLAVMPTPNADWARLNERLARAFGPEAPQRLGLVPDGDHVERDGVRYVIGSDAVADTYDAPHVWLVTRERYRVDVKVDPALRPSEVVAPEAFGDGELVVARLDRAGP